LSPGAVELAAKLVRLLRVEYKDGCRDRHAIDLNLEHWKKRVDELEPNETWPDFRGRKSRSRRLPR
jgi:hypothetical protein